MRIAAITMVFNERQFLPIWLNHYGPQLGYENLFVIDDGTSDGSTNDDRIVNPVYKKRAPFDEDARALVVSYFHESLLRFYDVVIYTDVDELIAIDPATRLSLSEYLANKDFQYKALVGMNVLHRASKEEDIDLQIPLFQQRSFIQFDPEYCKPLISRIPMRWRPGFHAASFPDFDRNLDPNLYLFHLRAMDINFARQRIATLNSVQFSMYSVIKRHGAQFQLPEKEYIARYFTAPEADFENANDDLEFIKAILPHRRFGSPIKRIPSRFANTISLNSRAITSSPPRIKASASLCDASLDAAKLFAHSLERMLTALPQRRNELCLCGSNKRYKHCHGASAIH